MTDTPRHSFVEISEHTSERDFVPFSAGQRFKPGRFEASRIYGPFTAQGAKRVQTRAFNALMSALMDNGGWIDAGSYPATDSRWIADGTEPSIAFIVRIHSNGLPYSWRGRPTGRNLPATYPSERTN